MAKSQKTTSDTHVARRCRETVAWDSEVPQLGLRQRPTRTTWIVQWREAGRTRKQTLGRAEDITVENARVLALGILRCDAVPPKVTSLSVTELSQRYLADNASGWKASTCKANAASFRGQIIPYLGGVRVADLSRDDVVAWMQALTCAAGSINRALAILSGMMRYAEMRGLRTPDSNPCQGLRRHKSSFEARYLDGTEWARLGVTLATLSKPHPREVGLIRFLALTGCRRGEALGLKWAPIDGPRCALPDAKSGPRAIWLGGPAMRMLADFPRSKAYVFGAGEDPLPGSDLDAVWHVVRNRAGLGSLRLHDLRHSFASVAINAGCSLKVVGGLLGHADLDTTRGYAHLELKTVQAASQRVGKHLTRTLTSKQPRPKSQFEVYATSPLSIPAFCERHGHDESQFRQDLIAWRASMQNARTAL